MAAEIHRLIGDLLEKLPNHHPDRRFLEGSEELFAAYLEQTAVIQEDAEMPPANAAVTAEVGAEPSHAFTTLPQEVPIERPIEPAEHADPTGQTVGRPESPEQATAPEQERVRLLGRLGAAPAFRRTPKSTLVGTFLLGVHHDE